jgi:uncharacterized protein (TIGR02147 family)
VYEYRDYKACFLDLINADAPTSRGRRKAIAQAVGCQVSHVTTVLSGAGHFSQEQTEAVCRYFGLDAHETEFMLSLVQFNRAGTESLKKFYERLLCQKQENFAGLKSRFRMPDSLKTEEEGLYYSSWQSGAAHVLLSSPKFNSRDAIAEKLKLPSARVDEILAFLVRAGLAEKKHQKFAIGRSLIHLDKKSPLISRHHANWRMRAIQSLDDGEADELHYSSVFSLAKSDVPKVREIFAQALTEALKIISKSPEETIASICLDVFRI